jgi:hypothetical protein
MPYIESVDELVEWIADKMGVYGTGPGDVPEGHPDNCPCRICFTIEMKERIYKAVESHPRCTCCEGNEDGKETTSRRRCSVHGE